MKIEAILTVSQSKRIIAHGVKNHPLVKNALKNGTIGICRGTTCTYVAEEFLGQSVEKFSYTLGIVTPKTPSPKITSSKTTMNDIIIRNGEIHMDGTMVIDASRDMTAGDVIIKGANSLNYEGNIAGCLIGHGAQGGTVGGFWGPMYANKINLIIPVGLEKETAADIIEMSEMLKDGSLNNGLMPMTGIIITEIEAINILTGASAYQIAAGGIRGAEGSVRLLIDGNPEQISEAKRIIAETENEPSF